jgi:tRNA nucleotidyltransferase (CCA-adding enzyme)
MAVKSAMEGKSGISAFQRIKLEGIVRRVLDDVKPTEDEMRRITAYSNELMGRLKSAAPKDVEIAFVGSAARGTQIKGSYDMDIFLLFPKGLKEREMENKGLAIAKSIVNRGRGETFIIKYAEHPYLKLIVDSGTGLTADIVPAFKIENAREIGTSVDRTQLHNKFISARLTESEKDNVRVLKAFLKAHNIYGANAKYEGFSGYACELMVYQFGSFINVLQEFSKLNLPLALDPLNRETYRPHHERTGILAKKFKSRFVLIDPTDENRNVTAATSIESIARLCITSRLMLKKPSIGFFYGPRHSDTYSSNRISKLRKELGIDLYLVRFAVPNISEDIIWQQLRRFSKRLSDMLEDNGFSTALSVDSVSKEGAMAAFFISRMKKHYDIIEGPSSFMHVASDRFLDSHGNAIGTFFKDDRLVFIEESRFSDPEEVLRHAIKNEKSLPSYLDRKKVKIYANEIPEELAKPLYDSFIRKTSI